MSTQVTLTSISGTPPYNIWVCDTTGNTQTCIYVSTTPDSPYSFILPSEFENVTQFYIKLTDGYGCVRNNPYSN